jgi:hypothetical protein
LQEDFGPFDQEGFLGGICSTKKFLMASGLAATPAARFAAKTSREKG